MQNLPKMSVALWCSFALIAGMKFADGGRDPQFLAMVVLWPASTVRVVGLPEIESGHVPL